MQAGKFDLNDLAEQLQKMKKLGGMGGIMGMLPGMGKVKEQIAAAGLDDRLFDCQLAIISSMTPQERANPELLKHSRKQRIAKGSGTTAADINKLLKMYRQMADMMKAMGGKGKSGLMGKMLGGLGSKMGFGGMGNLGGNSPAMPDLSGLDPKQFSTLQKQIENGNGGKLLPGLPSVDLHFLVFPMALPIGKNFLSILRKIRCKEGKEYDAGNSIKRIGTFTSIY